MQFELVKIFVEMGFFAKLIVAILMGMGVISLAVFIEKNWLCYTVKNSANKYIHLLHTTKESYVTLIKKSEPFKNNPLTKLIIGNLQVFLKTNSDLAVRREHARQVEALSMQLRSSLNILASIGSIAPFVGLLGTVVGIIDAFSHIAETNSSGIGAVSSGIAEALVVTALGLVIAIPTVLAFNHLSSKTDKLLLGLEQHSEQFIDQLEVPAYNQSKTA